MRERRLGHEHVDALAAGAALLGAGGGGSVEVGTQLLKHLLGRRPVRLVRADTLPPDDLVVHVGAIGSPDVISERLVNPVDLARAASAVVDQVVGPIRAVGAFEIGGLNALMGAIGAAEMGLPLIDGDLMGRAFPRMLQNTLAYGGVAPVPMSVAGPVGDVVVIPACAPRSVEPLLSGITAAMGGAASFAAYPVGARELSRLGVAGSITACLELGRAFLASRSATVPVMAEQVGATLHCEGRVDEVAERTSSSPGSITVRPRDGVAVVRVDHQEEFLAVTRDGRVRACAPEVVAVLDSRTRHPLRVDQVRVGQAIVVCSLPGLHRWPAHAQGLVGPAAFGLELETGAR